MCVLNCYLCPSIVYVFNLNTHHYYNYGYVGKRRDVQDSSHHLSYDVSSASSQRRDEGI